MASTAMSARVGGGSDGGRRSQMWVNSSRTIRGMSESSSTEITGD